MPWDIFSRQSGLAVKVQEYLVEVRDDTPKREDIKKQFSGCYITFSWSKNVTENCLKNLLL